MPIAVITNDVSNKISLKSLPGAYVIVRRMTYGEELSRSALAANFFVGKNDSSSDVEGRMKLNTSEVAYWDFANLIVEHNLQDSDGRDLNFKNPNDVKKLNPNIGKEVGDIIDEFNSVKESDEIKN